MTPITFKAFISLPDAVDFLVDNLDKADIDAIANECTDSQHDSALRLASLPPRRDYRVRAIQALAARHADQSLRTLYQGREFPHDRPVFKLGGHAQELGHLHIDFTRSETGWQLKEIWICR